MILITHTHADHMDPAILKTLKNASTVIVTFPAVADTLNGAAGEEWRVGPRLACQLIRLQEQAGQPINGSVEIRLSREELAQMTGTTLFTVSRVLGAWEARGLVDLRRDSVTVCDLESLRKISEDT